MVCNPRVVLPLLMLALLAPLAAHVALGSYSRLLADDYCSAAVAQDQGLLGGTRYWYESWSGRYAASALDALTGLAGPAAVRVGPALALALWLPLLAAAIALLTPHAPGRSRLGGAALLATGILYATLLVTPTVAQSLYWGQGMRSVVPPLIMLTAYVVVVGLSAGGPRRPVAQVATWAVGAALALAAAGFNETYTAAQVLILGGALAAVLAWGGSRRRVLAPGLVIGLAAALVGLGLMIAAPGNAVRQAYFPPPPGPPMLLAIATGSALLALFRHILADPAALLGLAGLLALAVTLGAQGPALGPASVGRLYTLLWGLPAAALGLIFFCFIPAAYGMSGQPPPRTLIIPAYLLACAVAAEGHLIGRLLASGAGLTGYRRTLVAAGLVALAAVAAWSTADLLGQVPAHRAYAAAWDATDAELRAAAAGGAPAATVPITPNLAGLEDVGPDAAHWVNVCVSDYYNITVTAAAPGV